MPIVPTSPSLPPSLPLSRPPASIDATEESDRLGRLVNHSRQNPNLQTKVVSHCDQPRLILVARREVGEGDELLYDYGDRSKESLKAHPWLNL